MLGVEMDRYRSALGLALGLVWFSGLGGCAKQVKSPSSAGGPKQAAPAVDPMAAEVEAQATGLRNDAECTFEVARLSKDPNQEDRAWALLRACLAMRKFNDLKLVVNPPFFWRLQLLGRYESARLLAHVLALRSTDLRRDLKVIEKAGISISPLESACDSPDLHKRNLVAFRGRLLREDLSSTRVKFAEIDKVAIQFKPGPKDPHGLSGRKVVGTVEPALRQRLRPESEYVGIGYLEDARTFEENGEPVQEARLELVEAVEPRSLSSPL
jgi:hypothetical protein